VIDKSSVESKISRLAIIGRFLDYHSIVIPHLKFKFGQLTPQFEEFVAMIFICQIEGVDLDTVRIIY
jgi:hypothetical protein